MGIIRITLLVGYASSRLVGLPCCAPAIPFLLHAFISCGHSKAVAQPVPRLRSVEPEADDEEAMIQSIIKDTAFVASGATFRGLDFSDSRPVLRAAESSSSRIYKPFQCSVSCLFLKNDPNDHGASL